MKIKANQRQLAAAQQQLARLLVLTEKATSRFEGIWLGAEIAGDPLLAIQASLEELIEDTKNAIDLVSLTLHGQSHARRR